MTDAPRDTMRIVTITLNPSIDKTFSVDRIIPDRKLVGRGVRAYPGGGGLNVARAATRLGVQTHARWSLGGDAGHRLAGLLDREGVSHSPVPVQGNVRENLIIRDDSTDEQFRFGLPGPSLSKADQERWTTEVREISPRARYVVFSGSLPGDATPDWYEALLREVPDGPRIIVDTKKEALRRALRVGVFLIKPNAHELEELVGRELPDDEALEEASREIVTQGGAEAVVVSLGRAGAMLVTRDTVERFLAPSVRPRSKVGAGDSMTAGIVTALAQERPLSDATRLGVAAGTAAVLAEGTGLCQREDTERLYESVHRRA